MQFLKKLLCYMGMGLVLFFCFFLFSRCSDTPTYEEGYEVGFEAGRESGYDEATEGISNGYHEGYDEGYDEGYEEGYDEGYEEGYEDGLEAGRAYGYSAGAESGYLEGYDDGYNDGLADASSEGLPSPSVPSEPEEAPPSSVTIPRGHTADETVYVSDRSGTIHSESDCSGMKYYTRMTLEEALEKGFTNYCEHCF